MSNPRFAEYATSGAFSLSLSRHQVSTLSMIAQGGDGAWSSGPALERKGLAVAVAMPHIGHDRFEYRATLAGLLCAKLLREAGLSNGPEDPMAAELAAMRAEVQATRAAIHEVRLNASAAFARKDEAERELADAKREIHRLQNEARGLRLKPEFDRPYDMAPCITLRDPLPDRADADIRAVLQPD